MFVLEYILIAFSCHPDGQLIIFIRAIFATCMCISFPNYLPIGLTLSLTWIHSVVLPEGLTSQSLKFWLDLVSTNCLSFAAVVGTSTFRHPSYPAGNWVGYVSIQSRIQQTPRATLCLNLPIEGCRVSRLKYSVKLSLRLLTSMLLLAYLDVHGVYCYHGVWCRISPVRPSASMRPTVLRFQSLRPRSLKCVLLNVLVNETL